MTFRYLLALAIAVLVTVLPCSVTSQVRIGSTDLRLGQARESVLAVRRRWWRGVYISKMPEGMQSQYADVRSTHYRRSFALSSELQTTKIDANLKDGVLTVRIPKHAEARPRKIEVRTD